MKKRSSSAPASLLEESHAPYFLLLLVTSKGTINNLIAGEVEEAWNVSLHFPDEQVKLGIWGIALFKSLVELNRMA